MKKNGSNHYFVYGLHTVMAILRYQPQRAKKLFLARIKSADEVKGLAEASGITVEYCERMDLEKRFSVSSDAQGVLLVCHPLHLLSLDELLHKKPTILLLLDSLQDNINLGRIARSALALGAGGIVLTKDRSAQVNAAAEKAAVGAFAKMPVAQVTNLAMAITALKENDFFIYGADERGEVDLNKAQFAKKSAIVIGQEGEGLRELTKKKCDLLIKIPMQAPDICLNAADAALLFLYQIAISQ